jgi:hypothetical protein
VFKARIHIEAYGRSGSHNQGTAGTRAPAPWENGPRCNDRNCHDGCNAVRVRDRARQPGQSGENSIVGQLSRKSAVEILEKMG